MGTLNFYKNGIIEIAKGSICKKLCLEENRILTGIVITCEDINPGSASEYQNHTVTYLKEDIENDAILGSFSDLHVGLLHISPL